MATKPFEFKVGQRFESNLTGSIREITEVRSRDVDYTIHYPAETGVRESRIWGASKRSVREMIDNDEIRQVA